MRFSLPCLISLLVFGCLACGAPYDGDILDLQQPDGMPVQARFYGDEYYCRAESLDGYTLMRDPATGWIVYAEINADASEFTPTDVVYDHRRPTDPNSPAFTKARIGGGKTAGKGKQLQKGLRLRRGVEEGKHLKHRMELLEQVYSSPEIREAEASESAAAETAAAPISGSIVGLTLLVEFQDVRGTIPASEIERYCNEPGYSGYGNNGSVRDYFLAVSNGMMDYTNLVTDYILLDYDKSYYDTCDGWGKTGELIDHALAKLCASGFDFSTLTKRNGRAMAFNIFYAGTPACGWSKGLWPHASSRYVTVCGTSFGSYQMSDIGSSLQIRTFCHENGHMVCQYPDLYDYSYDTNGAGNFCFMAYGGSNTNPVPPCGYLRGQTGWETFTSINNDAPGTIRTHTANTNTSFKYTNPLAGTEYFLIESRLKTGRNASLPGEGLLVWHIRENGSNTAPSPHPTHPYRKSFKVAVEQADNQFHLETDINYGAASDFFYDGYKSYFSGLSLPDAVWWSTDNSGLKISDVSAIGPTMTFVVGKEPVFDARWRLDETTGTTATDSNSSARHGTLQNGLNFATNSGMGMFGRCLNFDGVDDYIKLPSMPVCFTNGFSISLWANPTEVKKWARLIEFGNGSSSSNIVFGRYDTTNDLTFHVWNGSTSGSHVRATNALELNKWQFFTVTIDAAGNTKIYKNAILAGSGATTAPLAKNYRYSNFIGKSNWSADAYYKGSMDDVRCFNHVLTESEIQALYVLEGHQPYDGVPRQIPGRIQAEHFDFGYEGVGYHDTTGGNTGGKLRPTEDVDIITTTDTSGAYAVQNIEAGEWLRYTVNISESSLYSFYIRAAVNGIDVPVTVKLNDAVIGMALLSGTSLSEFKGFNLTNLDMAAGTEQDLRLEFPSGGLVLNWVEFVKQGPWGGQVRAIPGRIEAEEFDIAGEGVSYHDTTAGNSGGAFRVGEDVDITAITGGYAITDTADGEWLRYTVNTTACTTDIHARIASVQAGGQIRVLLNDQLLATINVPGTGSLTTWQTVSANDVLIPEGLGQNLRIEMVNGGFSLQWIDFSNRQPYLGDPFAIAGHIDFFNYDVGGQYISYYDTNPGNSYGQYRSDDVEIRLTDDASGFCLYASTTEWLEYTCSIQPGFYTIVVNSSGTNAALQTLSVDGVQVATFSLPDRDAWYNWADTSVSNVYLSGGPEQILRFTMTSSTAMLRWVDFYRRYNAADLNQDTVVNLDDFKILSSQWMGLPAVPSADIAQNEFVDANDLMIMTDNWLVID